MTDKVNVREHKRNKPTEKPPKEISNPQQRAMKGVQIVGGGDPRKPQTSQGKVQIVRREP